MSTFILKLFALVAMLIDHVACVLGWEGWDLLPINATILRYIGRLSFPIFALCIVNGWKYTRSKEKYFINLCICALFSQIPFSLAFYMPNRMAISHAEQSFTYIFNPVWIIIALICVITYWYFVLHKQISKSLFIVAAVCLLPTVFVKINYMWVLSDSLNVLYTLTVGVAAIYAIETIKSKSLRWWESIWLIGAVSIAAAVYCPMADYGTGMLGLLLIVALYAAQNWKPLQSLSMVIWGGILYGIVIGNWNNALATVVPALLIFFHNPNHGLKSKFTKQLFYVFYPLHLLVLGLINIYLRLLG